MRPLDVIVHCNTARSLARARRLKPKQHHVGLKSVRIGQSV